MQNESTERRFSDQNDSAFVSGIKKPVPTPDTLAGLKLLIVDDQEDMRLVLKMVLKRHGAEVQEADSVETALELLKSFQPNVIVSDIAMPEQTGYDLVRKLRKEIEADIELHEKIPAIALSSHADQHSKMRAIAEGFQVHLSKPFGQKNLVQVVSALATLDGDAVEHGVDMQNLLEPPPQLP